MNVSRPRYCTTVWTLLDAGNLTKSQTVASEKRDTGGSMTTGTALETCPVVVVCWVRCQIGASSGKSAGPNILADAEDESGFGGSFQHTGSQKGCQWQKPVCCGL